MSSKDSILASIRRHTGARHEMPELTLEAITYADKLATFSEVLAGAGGKAIELKPGEDVNEVIRREFPGGETYRLEFEGDYLRYL